MVEVLRGVGQVGVEGNEALVCEQRATRCGQRQGRDDGADVRLEQVRPHARNVAHVVAHVVGDGGGVAGVILGNARLDLADKVGSNVGRLGVDAPAHPGEQGDRRRAHAEPGDDLDVLEYPVQDRNAEQSDADDRQPHDRAAVEGQSQCWVQSRLRLDRRARIGAHRYAHADVPGQRRSDRPNQVGDGRRRDAVRAFTDLAENVVVDEQGKNDDDHNNEDGQNAVLALEEGCRSLPDGVADEPHPLVALVLPQDACGQVHGEQQPDDRSADCEEDDFLHLVPHEKASPATGRLRVLCLRSEAP